nr:DUF5688 family protein [uncultured Blautia sp.]
MESKMLYQEFQERLCQEVRRELNQQGTYHCEVMQNQKNNAILWGLSVRKEDSSMAAVIYLDKPYQSYLRGKPLEEISKELISVYKDQKIPHIDETFFTDYETVKDRIQVRLVSREKNQAYYRRGPYKMHPMGAEVLFIELQSDREGTMQAQVTNKMAEQWKIPKSDLFQRALENTLSRNKAVFSAMGDVIAELIMEDGAEVPETEGVSPMYVLSNEKREYGATVLLYPDVLKAVRKRLGEDFYILPSSLHETIILPKGLVTMDMKELRDVVREINQNEVQTEEVLGNEVYEYRGATNKVRKCSKEDRER